MQNRTTLFFITTLLMFAFAGCSSSSNPGNSTNTNGTSPSVGSDYFPLAGNTVIHSHVTGTSSTFDSNGALIGTDKVDEDAQVAIGLETTRSGLDVHPIYVWNFDGTPTNNGLPLCYLGIVDSNEVFGLNQYSNGTTILPANISVGQFWIPAPTTGLEMKATVVAQLPSYTTAVGKTYQNVLQIYGTYLDSTSGLSGYGYYSLHDEGANGTIYFAKGIGLVEITVNNYHLVQEYPTSPTTYYYSKKVMSGVVSRTN